MNSRLQNLSSSFFPIVLIVLAGTISTSFSLNQSGTEQDCLRKTQRNQSLESAIQDTRNSQDCERWSNLTSIVKENPKLIWQGEQVLMLSWVQDADCPSDPGERSPLSCLKKGASTIVHNSPEGYSLWVTPVPEVKEFVLQQNYLGGSVNLSDRLAQYLGLRSAEGYDRFIEIWVNPSDLIRPCVDTEITDNGCDLWTSEQRDPRLSSARNSDFPFTGLGYTYDWGNPDTDVGTSEFVVRDGATVTVYANQSIDEYFQGLR